MTTDPPSDPAYDDLIRRWAGRRFGRSHKLEGEVTRGGMGSIIRIWDEDASE